MRIKAIRTKFFSVVIVSVLLILFMLNNLFINLMLNNRDVHIEKYRAYLQETTRIRLNLYVNDAVAEIEGFKSFILKKTDERIGATLETIQQALLVDRIEEENLDALLMKIQQYNINQNIFFYYQERELYRRIHKDGRIEERPMTETEFQEFLLSHPVIQTVDVEKHGMFVGVFFNIEGLDQIAKDSLIQLIETLIEGEEEYILIDEVLEDEDGNEFTRRIVPQDAKKDRRYIDVTGKDPYSVLLEDIRRDGEIHLTYYSNDRGRVRGYVRLYEPYNWMLIGGLQIAKEEEALEKEKDLIMRNFYNQVNTMLGVSFFTIVFIVFVLALMEKLLFEKFIQYTEGLESNADDYTTKTASLEKNSQIDEVTAIYNRRYMEMALKRQFDNEKRYALILIDIDFFKKVNDTYGHDAGDYILYQVSRLIKESLLLGDIVTRYGGEEFLIIVDEKNKKELFQYAERLRKEVEEAKFVYKEEEISITISLGASHVKSEDQTYMDAFNRSDRSLYMSKENGRNRTTLDEA